MWFGLPCVYAPFRISVSSAFEFVRPFNTQGLQQGIRAMDLACRIREKRLILCLSSYVPGHRLT